MTIVELLALVDALGTFTDHVYTEIKEAQKGDVITVKQQEELESRIANIRSRVGV